MEKLDNARVEELLREDDATVEEFLLEDDASVGAEKI